jgi:hypothetical protein
MPAKNSPNIKNTDRLEEGASNRATSSTWSKGKPQRKERRRSEACGVAVTNSQKGWRDDYWAARDEAADRPVRPRDC